MDESVHHVTADISSLVASFTRRANLKLKTAPNNSRRGIVCCCNGATFVLAVTKLTSTIPSHSERRYTTAAYARSEASVNVCSSNRVFWGSNFAGLKHCRIFNSRSSVSSCAKVFHLSVMLLGSSSSHDSPPFYFLPSRQMS